MKKSGIPIKGYRVNKDGKLVKNLRALSVSERLQREAKPRQKYKRGK